MYSIGVAPLVVIGIGNSMRSDDGVGLAAVARLENATGACDENSIELRTLDGEPTRLIEAWRGRRRVIVVDAARAGSSAGSIHRIEVGVDPLPEWASIASSHSAGVAEAIALARTIDALPDELILYGVEPADLSIGEGLSAAVASAVPRLVELLVAEVSQR
ncbi:MAG: hydrogenase maturation protease [Acidimicrobiales bacterium]